MAKCNGPLLSMQASGTIGPRLTFSKRKTGQQVRFQKAQVVDSASWSQLDNQSLYRAAYDRWICFSAAEKKVYNDKVEAQKLQMSGWNLFLKYAIADPKTYIGLVGYWTFNRPGFGTVLDISKNGNVGTLKPLFPSNCPAYVDSKNKKLGKGLSFDGVNDYVSVPSPAGSSLDITGNATVEAWVYASMASNDTSNRRIVQKDAGGLTFFYNVSGYQLGFGDNSGYMFVTGKNIRLGWHQLTAVKSGNTTADIKIYIDGVDQGTLTQAGTWDGWTSSANNFQIGTRCNASDNFWQGLIDDVRIYNRALSAGEVAQMYNSTKD